MQEIYLDNAATTRVFPEVAEQIRKAYLEEYGNPSSMHYKGIEAEGAVREAKSTLAKILKCTPKNLYFTSGGTESDNLAILGAAYAHRRRGQHLITSQIEHPAVLQTMRHLEEDGFSVTYLPVDRAGRIRLEDLEADLDTHSKETTLVSIMHTNNEIGSLQPIEEAGELIKRKCPETLFHVDAVQGFGKAWMHPQKWNVDLLTASGHKIHGPKGIGLLYVADEVRLLPISYGGGQQDGLRSGTENVPGIVGMALAARMLYTNLDTDIARMYALKKRLISGAMKIEGVQVNGIPSGGRAPERSEMQIANEDIRRTAPHIVSLSFPGVRSEVMLHTLEEEGICSSAGSACAAHRSKPSETLQAIGIPKPVLGSTLRFSFSVFTTEAEIDRTLDAIRMRAPALRKYVRR